jgi:hypothetical protein
MCEIIQKYSSDIISFVNTLFAAFLGAWFAFRLQNKSEMLKNELTTIFEINMLQLNLYKGYNSLLLLEKEYVNPFRSHPFYWIEIPSLLEVHDYSENIDISRIGFFIQSNNEDIIQDVMLIIEKHEELTKALNERSKIHRNEFQPIIEKVLKEKGRQIEINELFGVLGEKLSSELKGLTDQYLELLDETIKNYQITIDKVYKAGKKLYPKAKILQVK